MATFAQNKLYVKVDNQKTDLTDIVASNSAYPDLFDACIKSDDILDMQDKGYIVDTSRHLKLIRRISGSAWGGTGPGVKLDILNDYFKYYSWTNAPTVATRGSCPLVAATSGVTIPLAVKYTLAPDAESTFYYIHRHDGSLYYSTSSTPGQNESFISNADGVFLLLQGGGGDGATGTWWTFVAGGGEAGGGGGGGGATALVYINLKELGAHGFAPTIEIKLGKYSGGTSTYHDGIDASVFYYKNFSSAHQLMFAARGGKQGSSGNDGNNAGGAGGTFYINSAGLDNIDRSIHVAECYWSCAGGAGGAAGAASGQAAGVPFGLKKGKPGSPCEKTVFAPSIFKLSVDISNNTKSLSGATCKQGHGSTDRGGDSAYHSRGGGAGGSFLSFLYEGTDATKAMASNGYGWGGVGGDAWGFASNGGYIGSGSYCFIVTEYV